MIGKAHAKAQAECLERASVRLEMVRERMSLPDPVCEVDGGAFRALFPVGQWCMTSRFKC